MYMCLVCWASATLTQFHFIAAVCQVVPRQTVCASDDWGHDGACSQGYGGWKVGVVAKASPGCYMKRMPLLSTPTRARGHQAGSHSVQLSLLNCIWSGLISS